MEYPLADLVDRLSILRLKVERTKEENAILEFRSLLFELTKRIGTDVFNLDEFQGALSPAMRNRIRSVRDPFDRLYKINGQIWDLEADIRQGKEGVLGREEVGRRALAIRDLNKQRVAVKNSIVELSGKGFKDVKKNHASA